MQIGVHNHLGLVLTCLVIGGHSHHATPLAARCTNCQVTATTTATLADCMQHHSMPPCRCLFRTTDAARAARTLSARSGWLHALLCVVDIVCVRRQCLQKRQCAFCCLSATPAARRRRCNWGQGPHCRRVYDCAHTHTDTHAHISEQCGGACVCLCVCVRKVSLLIFFSHSKSARYKRLATCVARNVHRGVFVKGQAVHWPWLRSIRFASMLVLLLLLWCSLCPDVHGPAYDCRSSQQQVQHT